MACANKNNQNLKGSIFIDGSSTVYPIISAATKKFNQTYPNVIFEIQVSGTTGGFRRMSKDKITIVNASRKIKNAEKKALEEEGIDLKEFQIAMDEVILVANPTNDWLHELSIEQLKLIWLDQIQTWDQLNATWPHEKIKLFGPGRSSGTRSFFNSVIGNDDFVSKKEFLSENDNQLVKSIAGEQYSLGYFGKVYYSKNKKNLKRIKIKDNSNVFKRGLYIYVNASDLSKEHVSIFLNYLFKNLKEAVKDGGAILLSDEHYNTLNIQLNKSINQ